MTHLTLWPQIQPSKWLLLDLDLCKGGDDGIGLVQRLREAAMLIPPVIILSAHQTDVLRSAATVIGAVMTLQKPFTAGALRQALEKVLQRR